MDLEGTIASVDLIGVMVRLAQSGFMGAIRFEQGDAIKILYLREGNVIAASTNDHADSLDELLLRSGRVTREHVRQALARRKDDETLGDALLGLGFITRKELLWARRTQIVGILRSVLDWTDGSYAVVHDHQPRYADNVAFPLEQIVVELVVTGKDRERIERELGRGDRVFVRTPDFSFRYSRLDLNAEADRIVAKIDGERTTAEIAAAVTRDEFTVYKLLHALATLGLIEERGKSQVTREVLLPGVLRQAIDDTAQDTSTPAPSATASWGEADHSAEIRTEEEPASEPVREEDLQPWEPEWPDESTERYPKDEIDVMSDDREGGAPIESAVGGETDEPRPFDLELDRPPEPLPERTPDLWPARREGIGGIPWPVVGVIALVVVVAAGWWTYRKFIPAAKSSVASEGPPGGRIVMPPTPGEQAKETQEANDAAGKSTATAEPRGAAIERNPKGADVRSQRSTTSPPKSVPEVRASRSAPAAVEKSDPLRARYDQMAKAFVRNSNPSSYSIQFELVCETSSVTLAINEGGSRVWFVPVQHGSRSCYRVFWGHFDSVQAAQASIGEIPTRLRGGSPRVVRVGEVVPR